MLASILKPCDRSRAPYCSEVWKYQGSSAWASISRLASTCPKASRTEATQPDPPNSAANRPPGLSARQMTEITDWV